MQEQIIVSEAMQSTSRTIIEQEHVYFLKEIIDTKYLGTPLFSRLEFQISFLRLKMLISAFRINVQMERWSREFRGNYLDNGIYSSKFQLRNDRSTFDYDVQGVLWASRKGYKGKWPL